MNDENPTGQGSSLTPRLCELLTEQLERHLNDLAYGPMSYQGESDDPRRRRRFFDRFVGKPERRVAWQGSIDIVRELATVLGRDLAQPDLRLVETEWDEAQGKEVVTAEHSWADALVALEEMIALRNEEESLRAENRRLLSQRRDIDAKLRAIDPGARK